MKLPTLLGEENYFATELSQSIQNCNKRIEKVFNIRRDLLRIKYTTDGSRLITHWEEDTLKRTRLFIRHELFLCKQYKRKLKEVKHINN